MQISDPISFRIGKMHGMFCGLLQPLCGVNTIHRARRSSDCVRTRGVEMRAWVSYKNLSRHLISICRIYISIMLYAVFLSCRFSEHLSPVCVRQGRRRTASSTLPSVPLVGFRSSAGVRIKRDLCGRIGSMDRWIDARIWWCFFLGGGF